VIRKEKASGTTRTGAPSWPRFHPEGDTLVVTRTDRLARSIADLQDIVRTLKARGATLRATERPIDTSTAAGKCFLDMLGVFAECQFLSATIAIAMLKSFTLKRLPFFGHLPQCSMTTFRPRLIGVICFVHAGSSTGGNHYGS
jgi:Resolvase, N terminal domain